jgi:hypothetical protein
MIHHPAHALLRATTAAALTAAIGAIVAIPAPAQARVFVGVGIGVPYFGPAYIPPPVYYPPPMYYAPPVYYPPPPVYYSQPQTYTPVQPYAAGGQACHAGAYVCPMDRPVAAGSACYCSGNDGQRVWGRAG